MIIQIFDFFNSIDDKVLFNFSYTLFIYFLIVFSVVVELGYTILFFFLNFLVCLLIAVFLNFIILYFQYSFLKDFFRICHFFARFKYFSRKSLYSKKFIQKIKKLLTLKFYVKTFVAFLNNGVATTIYQYNDYVNLTSLRRYGLLSSYEMQACFLRYVSVLVFGGLFYFGRIYVELFVLIAFWQYFLLWISCTDNSKLFSVFYLLNLIRLHLVDYAMEQVILFNILKNTFNNWGKLPYDQQDRIIDRLPPCYEATQLKTQRSHDRRVIRIGFSFFFFFLILV